MGYYNRFGYDLQPQFYVFPFFTEENMAGGKKFGNKFRILNFNGCQFAYLILK